jgi:methionine sulfoxide reductase catalytic subunit
MMCFMPTRTGKPHRYSDVTPIDIYLNRRAFLAGLSAAFLTGEPLAAATKLSGVNKSALSTSEKQNTFEEVSRYNNFYEFGTRKTQPVDLAKDFRTSPWTLSVEGLAAKPRKFSLDELMKVAPLEERIYRHRCVEGWSIVVPWIGYSLSALLQKVEPDPKAKYVAFESFYDPAQMPEAKNARLDFPYLEGLRLDEAMHPLTILTVGMYGETLPPQDGAPIRLTVPWKYGFKGAKSLVRIKLVDRQPPCTWNLKKPNEYGFYANVNPAVDHPRWSQATERRLGELLKRPTLPFNGYADQVAQLYSGMDLKQNF